MNNVQLRYPHPGWRQRLDAYFANLGQGVNAATLMRARMGEVAGLESLSDAELREIGLRRVDIPARVFDDMFAA
ncbi:hypothetical protein PGB28_03375 [Primorskyibacter aestuariivivens]|uniref:hypothetical protein n=1 Tax=Primorskyibacter aestuariivivens TaxID=1888912 RepID=UPI0023015295|nr:hypothetical protein [Primorskyibacter aestuariivivens]MDA7427486.1 hypothetical protein [Primorskyibacter aestuariivivens]